MKSVTPESAKYIGSAQNLSVPKHLYGLITLLLALSNQIIAEEAVNSPSSPMIENRLAEIEVIEVTSHKPLEFHSNSNIDPEIIDIIEESNSLSHDRQIKEQTH